MDHYYLWDQATGDEWGFETREQAVAAMAGMLIAWGPERCASFSLHVDLGDGWTLELANADLLVAAREIASRD